MYTTFTLRKDSEGEEAVEADLKGMSLDEPFFFFITIIITRPLATLWRVF
jgi:hypothetical protein